MRILIKLSLLLSVCSWCFIQTNPNFKTRHKPGVMRHNYRLVGQWHIQFTDQQNKAADWFLYKQMEQQPQGIAVRYKIVIVTQQDFMIASSRPFPVMVSKKIQKTFSYQNSAIIEYVIKLGSVFKLDVLNGVLYQVQTPKDKVIGYII